MRKSAFILFILIISVTDLLSQKSNFPKLTDPYLGQKPPGIAPELFAKEIITARYQDNNNSPTFSPDMNEIYWTASFKSGAPTVILFMKRKDNKWTEPQVAPFSGQYSDGGPCISPDNKRLFYHSARPLDGTGKPKDRDIWFVERTGTGWSKPINAGKAVNTAKDETYPSVSKNGTLYFNAFSEGYQANLAIFQSRHINGEYSERVVMDEMINSKKGFNWCPFIDPDEKYLLFSSGRDGQEWDDLYCSFRKGSDGWSEPKRLSTPVNSDLNDRFPRVSPDGKYLFFSRPGSNFKLFYEEPQSLRQLLDEYGKMNDDIYWVSAKIIEEIKQRNN